MEESSVTLTVPTNTQDLSDRLSRCETEPTCCHEAEVAVSPHMQITTNR